MKKVLIIGLVFLIFALTAEMPRALAVEPPTSPWPPEQEWHPMPPPEPQMSSIPIFGGDYYLKQGESFFFFYGWFFIPTNVAYDLTTGQPETSAFTNLKDSTDAANALYIVTMNGQLLEPTFTFSGTCKWCRVVAADGRWFVVPRAMVRFYYIVFPNGLLAGEYTIETCCRPVNPQVYPEPLYFTTFLHVKA